MDSEYIREPKDRLVTYGPDVIEDIRRDFNIQNKADREKAIAILDQWIKSQDHFMKKDFSKGYIERCIITSKGSLERAKKQIDKMCTMRTLMPKYFQITDIKKSVLMKILNRSNVAIMPRLTKNGCRVVIVKVNPNVDVKSMDYTYFFMLLVVLAEYFKANDYTRGFMLVGDCFDVSIADILSKINLVELQQFIPIMTEGYGCKIKGIVFITASKFIESFIRLVKPLFSEKIGNRIHAISTRKQLADIVSGDILPKEYGGSTERPVEELHHDLVEGLSAPPVVELLTEMNKAYTDESKRKIDEFNAKYMGMPGTFRTLSLD